MTVNQVKWLDSFFGPGNEWCLEKIQDGGYPGVLQTHLESMVRRAVNHDTPFVLPRLDDSKQLWFYVVGGNRRELAEIRRVIRAHLGRVKSHLDPRTFCSSEDPVEISILSRYPTGFCKVHVPLALNSDKPAVFSVFAQINSAIEQYARKPVGAAMTYRPVGRMLHDFFIACGRNDGDGALEFFAELKNSGKLSSRNLVSAELQALAAGQRWRKLLDHPRLPDLLNGRIPGVIVDVVLDAVQHRTIRTDDPTDNDIEHLQAELLPFSNIFLRTPDLHPDRRVDAWKAWSIGAAALGYGRVLEALPRSSIGAEWVDRLTRWAELHPEISDQTDPVEAALQSEPNVDCAAIMLQESLVMNPNDGMQVYQRLAEYPSSILNEIRAHKFLGGVWTALEVEYSSTATIDGWDSWLESLIRDSDNALPLQTVVEECRNWPLEKWEESKVREKLEELADTDSSSTVRDVAPVLRNWLRSYKIGLSAELIGQVMVILALDEIYSVQDLALFSELITDLVEIPHEKHQYKEAVEAANVCWEQVKSVKSLEHGLEVMEVLLDAVCPDNQTRLDYWNSLQEFCISSWHRLADDQQLVFMRTAEDAIGSSSQFPPLRPNEDSPIAQEIDLTNKRLAIYTLTEGAARRTRAVLSKLFPAMEIRLNHDKSATTELVNLAKTADYFVFASRSASHQAFYPVTKRRDDILYPAGKGSSSIIRCFLEAIQN